MSSAVWSKPKTVLVTGGTGFVGTYVCRLLGQQNQSAIAFGVEPFTPEALFVLGVAAAATRFVHGDVQDLAALNAISAAAKQDAIIHAAGLVGHDASLANPGRTYAVNVGGTVNVFEAARKANISKVLVISSNAAYHKKTPDNVDIFRQSECPLRGVKGGGGASGACLSHVPRHGCHRDPDHERLWLWHEAGPDAVEADRRRRSERSKSVDLVRR